MAAAALYCRSSKDRSDISPAAQRHALEQLATSRSLPIVATFEDAVESGATEDRPGFQALIRAIKDPGRRWNHLLVYDTSRIARRRYIAQAFKHELKKRGITLLYATRPADIDPISEVVLDSMLEAMDEVHSLMSREKGLAGMAENVRQGFRAGGRAPFGYRLKFLETGAIREGKPVTKSRLELAENADQVRTYFRARAEGAPRKVARELAGLDLNHSTLVSMEWNALTYAGHTVWNVHREPGAGTKRRPREEWKINRGTHPALISDSEAERILVRLEQGEHGAAIRAARAASSSFLLAGLLVTTDGRTWLGHGDHYRLRRGGYRIGRIVPAARIESAVIETLRTFRTTDTYLTWLRGEIQTEEPPPSQADEIRGQIRRLERERQRAAQEVVATSAPETYRAIVERCSRKIAALTHEIEALEREASAGDGLKALGLAELRELVESQDPARVVLNLVERVVLEPTLECQIHVRRRPSYNRLWRSVASPGRSDCQPQGVVLPVAPRLLRLAG